MKSFLGKRDGWWHFVRRVPAIYAEHDRRGIVKLTTKVRVADDPRGLAAAKIAAKLNADLEAYWRGLFLGDGEDARKRFDAARQFARAVGFDYAPAAAIVARGPAEIVGRVETLSRKGLGSGTDGVQAVLGLVAAPALKLSALLTKYEELQRASLLDLSEEQKRRWRNAKRRAVEALIAIGGDRPVTEVTRGDALDLREHLQGRVLEGNIEIGTANKQIGHLNKMWRVLNTVERMGLDPVFAELRIEGEGEAQRAAFEPAFVRDSILAPGAFGQLNAEAVDIVYLIAETGLRLSEACNLGEATILLDAEVPHVLVEPDGRRMKTSQSRRAIPLVGVALAAMRRNPAGFPRYRDRNAGLSALVNRIMTEKGLRPSQAHSLYSLRHTFEDRLTAIEAPEKLIAALMGHKYSRPKYGSGPSLKQKLDWLSRIAFTPPTG